MKQLFTLLSVLVFTACTNKVEPAAAVRGVWVPDPHFTDVLKSYDNVKSFVATLDSLNFNSVFIVSYAKAKTIYPSQVLMENGIYANIDSTNMLSPYMATYSSPTGDPVRDLIDEAHKSDIKIFFWYEFGFMGGLGDVDYTHPLLAKNPQWLGLDNKGGAAAYNSHNYYFNSYDVDVQNFLIALVAEAMVRYPDLDGIQGDDRMPAAPRNSGYEKSTKALYMAQFGVEPPADFNDKDWVEWRLDLLNKFAVRLKDSVKRVSPAAMVSYSPNPYPWCEDNLMQDWPQWIADGTCDLLAVQCYRRDTASYIGALESSLDYISKNNPDQLFAPGILIMESGNLSSADMVEKQMLINRRYGVDGEIFFYNEGLNNPEIRSVIEKLYKEKVKFPTSR